VSAGHRRRVTGNRRCRLWTDTSRPPELGSDFSLAEWVCCRSDILDLDDFLTQLFQQSLNSKILTSSIWIWVWECDARWQVFSSSFYSWTQTKLFSRSEGSSFKLEVRRNPRHEEVDVKLHGPEVKWAFLYGRQDSWQNNLAPKFFLNKTFVLLP